MDLLYFLLIGLAAGFIAGKLMKSRLGLIGNLVLGVVGALVGGFLFGLLGLKAYGLVGPLVTATVGAMVVLYAARALAK